MNEINQRICKVCGQLKQRIFDGKFDKVNKRWRDESGKLWMGSTCGSCNIERSKNMMRKLRNVKRTKRLLRSKNGR